MKISALTVTAVLAATPLAAQSLRDCDTFEANARNIYGPYAETIREYANGAIRVIALDVGEPASASFHVMVTYPHPEDPWPQCSLVSSEGNVGFGWLNMAETEASYDPAIGLSVTIPIETVSGVASWDQLLTITVNQATGVVTPVLSGNAPTPAPAGSK
ncbi:hypothetical protein [Nioella aestuarii]|uniref:hypothetical protein n=1 Tax=Nioella aestuarii TaxID=1662864 RepID=UPI003D7F8271